MRPFSRIISLIGTLLLVVGIATNSFASTPPDQDAEVPAVAGEEAVYEWTGTILPGANTSSDCTQGAATVPDEHTIHMAVPNGIYDTLVVSAVFEINYDGPVDVIITVVKPDGEAISGDGGFIQTDESIALSNPEAGDFVVMACMFAGAAPQDYDGKLTLRTAVKSPGIATGPACDALGEALKFEEQVIDPTRAGGEPMVTTHPNGTLLWGSHAGTTHFFTPAAPDAQTAAFLQNYEGQTYQYYSDDGGKTWEFSPRTPINPEPLQNVPASGFSDPEFAIDQAGNVYISEINLANVAVSKSTDGGHTYALQNFVGLTGTDRQWNAADEENVVYMTGNHLVDGHILTKSIDGGLTWTPHESPNPAGVGDIRIDWADGTLYELSEDGGTLSMAAYRGIRGETENFTPPEMNTIAEGSGFSGITRQIGPVVEIDREGNLYVVWPENGEGVRDAGMYYSYSTDQGRTWFPPVRVDPDDRTDVWPWITVGAEGEVVIVYLGIENTYTGTAPAEQAEDDEGWDVYAAYTHDGLGCGNADIPGFTVVKASAEPVHYGTICQGGTACQAELVDRRLGDYFSNEIDTEGNLYIAVSTTARGGNQTGGAVSLPLYIGQVGGPNFGGGGPGPTVQPTQTASPSTSPSVDPTGGGTESPSESPTGATGTSTTGTTTGSTPETGSGMAAAGIGLLLVGAAAARGARRRGR